jgi:hypothetical protein
MSLHKFDTPGRSPERTTVSIRRAKTTGWDVKITREEGEVLTHCEDWHRLERVVARLGGDSHVVSVDND